MPRKSPLKVFRTTIGFHDAYVGAPSQKAALQAWGTDKNLFGLDLAEVVTDPTLTAEPLASPGTVILRSRGTEAEHLAAAGASAVKAAQTRRRKSTSTPTRDPSILATSKKVARKPVSKPNPKPSRDKLTEAEDALAAYELETKQELAELRELELQIEKERDVIQSKQRKRRSKLEEQVAKTRRQFEAALERWRME